MQYVAPIVALLLGIYWVFGAFNYGLWVRNGPGGGFLPLIGGLLTIVFSISLILQRRKAKDEEQGDKFSWKAFLPAVGLLLMVCLSQVVGMLVSMAIYIFTWLRFMEKEKLTRSLAISLGTVVVVYLVFVAWLRVPFPKGRLGLI
ncbi:MAG: tripartite tricarboxylate transporter TctB family protein [Firmicutes bacterium]|nr:tripartite tricarboxylate transporter TctB family protein [Bacillota bacterium]HHV94742.1 tripartite tricarboxylate transporter TctB family protein [Bacillota bacterium]